MNKYFPKISLNTKEINVNVCLNDTFKSSFQIKNVEGGTLSVQITSDIYGLDFSPSNFKENFKNIKYTYTPKYFNIGDVVEGNIFINSNGGEVNIPVKIKIIQDELLIDNKTINNLDSFTAFAQNDFLKAKKLFVSSNFLDICNINDLNLYKLYKRLDLELYKQTSLDNFLILTGKKQPAKIITTKPKAELKLNSFEERRIKFKIPLKVSGWGSIEANLKIKNKSKWIELKEESISLSNTKDGQELETFCIINPRLMETRIVRDIIIVDTDYYSTHLEIVVKKNALFLTNLSKDFYNMYDEGEIEVINNTKEDIVLEVIPYAKWIKFKSKKYFISTYAKIPFEINISNTFSFIQKTPIYSSSIMLKTIIRGKPIKKYLEINVYSSKLEEVLKA